MASTSLSSTGSRYVKGGAESLSPKIGNERHALATQNVVLGGRASMENGYSLEKNGGEVKRSGSGKVQGLYDPTTGKVYLIAKNIEKGKAKSVLLHEVGVHMATDSNFASKMKPVIKRAVQIVNVGNANGDPIAKTAMARLEAVGGVRVGAKGVKYVKQGFEEEACAYLVEESANAKDKASNPIKTWIEIYLRRFAIGCIVTALEMQMN